MIRKIKFYIVLCFSLSLFFVRFGFAEDTARELYANGQTAEGQGDLNQAVDDYEKAIEKDADFAPPYSALGTIYLDRNENLDDIVWLFQQAADLEPQNAMHYTNMCRAYFQFQKHDWAEAACLKALSIDPNAIGAKMTLAWVYLFGKAQPADAVRYFKQIIEKVPNPKVYYGLGMAYARNSEQANALEIITKLRGMGQETLASQLEKIMRPSGESVTLTPSIMPSVNAGPSGIVKAKPRPPGVDSAPSQAGVMHIKLKGKLSSVAGQSVETETPAEKAKKSADEDSELGEGHESTVAERMEKVRKMRGNRSRGKVRGNASVTVTGTAQTVPVTK